MRKILCLFGALTLLLASCSNDDNNSSDSNETVAILPKTIKTTFPAYPEESDLVTYAYNGNKVKSITVNDERTDYTYDGNLIVKSIVYDKENGRDVKTLETSYTYSNEKLISVSEKTGFSTQLPDGKIKNKYIYTHKTDGTITKDSYSINQTTGEEIKNYIEVFTYQNGNLVKMVAADTYGGSSRTSIYEYDSKNNPFKNVIGLNLLLDNEGVDSKNNLIKHSYSYSGSSTTSVYKYDFVYDVNGYPTKENHYGSDGTTISEVLDYTY